MEITYSKDRTSSAPTVVIRHLAGEASLGEMLHEQTPHRARACVFDLTVETPALIHVLRSIGALADLTDDLEYLKKNVPSDLLAKRCLVIPIRHDTASDS